MGFWAGLLVFLGVAGGVWWLLRKGPWNAVESPSPAEVMVAELEARNWRTSRSDTGLIAALARAKAHEAEDARIEDASVDAFRESLNEVAVPQITGRPIMLWYGNDEAAREVHVREVRAGRGNVYLHCWWPAREDTRLFHLGRVAMIVDGERSYEHAYEWLRLSGPEGSMLADELGWRGPPGGPA